MIDKVLFDESSKVEDIWTTARGTFFRQKDTDTVYAFGLNNVSQLALAEKSSDIFVFTPRLTLFKNIKKIVGKFFK